MGRDLLNRKLRCAVAPRGADELRLVSRRHASDQANATRTGKLQVQVARLAVVVKALSAQLVQTGRDGRATRAAQGVFIGF